MRAGAFVTAVAALCLAAGPLAAVEPDEMLADQALEQRAREISAGLRCLVCRNESIDESNADLAGDLRLLVRERLTLGDSDEEVMRHVVERYGEYVLLRPTATGANLLLWLGGPAMLAFAAALAAIYLRRRSRAPDTCGRPLEAQERARLREMPDERGPEGETGNERLPDD